MALASAATQRPGTTRTLLKGADGAGIVRRTVLPGGLRVVTETLPTVRSATFGIWVGVGSRDETPSSTAPRTTWSTCSSRAPSGAARWTSRPPWTRSAAR